MSDKLIAMGAFDTFRNGESLLDSKGSTRTLTPGQVRTYQIFPFAGKKKTSQLCPRSNQSLASYRKHGHLSDWHLDTLRRVWTLNITQHIRILEEKSKNHPVTWWNWRLEKLNFLWLMLVPSASALSPTCMESGFTLWAGRVSESTHQGKNRASF